MARDDCRACTHEHRPRGIHEEACPCGCPRFHDSILVPILAGALILAAIVVGLIVMAVVG